MSFLADVTNWGAVPLLEKTLAFTEARNKMFAENIANALTPGYQTKQLDVKAFQRALRDASNRRSGDSTFRMSGTDEVSMNGDGFLQVHPSQEPAENLLFQDETNSRIERQMAMLAENAMMNQMASETLRGSLEVVQKAIRGRAG